MNELISNILVKNPSHGRATVGRPARTYLQQLCVDTGCSRDDLQKAMDDRDEWPGKFKLEAYDDDNNYLLRMIIRYLKYNRV